MAEQLPKSRIEEMGNKQKKGDYFYRFLKMENGTSGEHWSKDEKVIDAHQKLFDEKLEIEYTWVKGEEGKGDKLRIYPPKEDGGKADTGKRKSEYAKNAEAKDDYWKGKDLHDREKWEWEKARFTRNDRKIEMQHYQNLLAPFFIAALGPDPGLEDVATAIRTLDKSATEMFDRHNPKQA